ncbi:MAG: hypothetical protein BGO13_12360 [Burkholderiales bacterium 66-5]|uniref:hypothetical protein n=1 Tax=Comamonas badia TaxID=265291 RepID=UPI00041CA0EC|nr:hypothetical protein [Comamonas badia]OJU89688.1 MAG: hypothetical protein BGO13_12360 [Burkholderiales bacterium 66-5]
MTADSGSGQVARMRSAIGEAVAAAPPFLRGEIDADQMAHRMIGAVRAYAEREQALGGDGKPETIEAEHLQHALMELMGCGSGYLEHRCDAA